MKWAFSKRFRWKIISSVYNFLDLTDLDVQFWLIVKFSLRWKWAGRSVLTNGKRPKISWCQVYAISRWEIKQLGCYFIPVFLCFPWKIPVSYPLMTVLINTVLLYAFLSRNYFLCLHTVVVVVSLLILLLCGFCNVNVVVNFFYFR